MRGRFSFQILSLTFQILSLTFQILFVNISDFALTSQILYWTPIKELPEKLL